VQKAGAALADVVMRRLADALPAVPLVEVKAFIAYGAGLGGLLKWSLHHSRRTTGPRSRREGRQGCTNRARS